MSIKYWFFLEPQVYVAVKGNNLLLYNLATGKYLTYFDQLPLIDFILKLTQEKNLYALEVSEDFIKANGLKSLIDDILEHFMGDIVDVSLSGKERKKPFIMPPQFDIQTGSRDPVRRTYKNVDKDSFLAIDELTFYVTGHCDKNCIECSTAYKQFLWCTRGKHDSELRLEDIEKVLDETRACRLKKINIIGGDLTRYSRLDELVDLLNEKNVPINYYIHFRHLKKKPMEKLKRIGPRSNILALVESSSLRNPDNVKHLKEEISEPLKLTFLVQDEPGLVNLEKAVEELNINTFSVQPYFNHRNLNFFKENVFTDEESLNESFPDLDAIKARQSYNTLNYGKLFIMSDKHIHSGLNASPLGTIDDKTMAEAVILELTEQGNWLTARRNVTPCKDCLFDAICPPLSGVEYAAGINNTCHLWKPDRH